MEEIITKRHEGSKTFDLNNGRKRLIAYPGPIHYRDHYDDPEEPWKDISLVWEGNRITKAPYVLVHDGNCITVTNKKTGEVHVLELIEKSKLLWERSSSRARADIDGGRIEIIPGRAFVRFRRSIKTEGPPLESRFRFEGDLKKVRLLGRHAKGPLMVEGTIKDGILTERIKLPKKPLTYPLHIDPTIDEYYVEASTDDVFWTDFPDSDYGRDWEFIGAGHGVSIVPDYIPDYFAYCGSGMRFIDIDIAKDSIIHAAYLTLRAAGSTSGTIRTDILVEDAADPATYPDNIGDFLVRRANTPTEGPLTEWDFDTPWVKGTDYDSMDFAWQIQHNVELADWVALNPISIFWDDKRHRTAPTWLHRIAYSWDAANP